MRRVLAVLAVMALFGAACGDDDDEAATEATGTAAGAEGPQTLTVEVDGKVPDLPMGAIAYFPSELTVHAGDTLKFHSNDTGEPHTVTFGTVVDKGLKAFEALPDEIKEADGPPDVSKLPEDQKKLVEEVEALDAALPELLPEGPGDANQLGANPCFVAGDKPPADTEKACPKVEQPAFDGTQAVYNSGFLPNDETFEVELAADLAPGTYNYFCLLHRQGMVGTVTVVPEAQKAQTADEVEKAAEKGLQETAAQLRPKFEELKKTPADKPFAGQPPSDSEEEEEGHGFLAPFAPEEIAINAGEAVTWTVFGPHTIAVNTPEDAVGIMTKAPDGTWHLNEKANTPQGGPGAPPPPEGDGPPGPPDPNAKPVFIDGGKFDGQGFHSSGFIPAFGPPGYQYKLTFTKAGTYKLQCQIHPDMKGTVKVT